jgi:hypothetical protein
MVFMNKKILFSGMLAMVLVFGVLFTGCASLTWNSPVTETGTASALETAEQSAGGEEIATYSIILGIFPLGLETFNGLVVAASRSGKKVDIMDQNYLFLRKIVAYARN